MFEASVIHQPDVEPLNGYDSHPCQILQQTGLLDGATVSINDQSMIQPHDRAIAIAPLLQGAAFYLQDGSQPRRPVET